jgi:hypothetical protein
VIQVTLAKDAALKKVRGLKLPIPISFLRPVGRRGIARPGTYKNEQRTN